MGILLALLLIIICGLFALIFSVLAWRLKNEIYFYIGLVATIIIIIYSAINYLYLYSLLHLSIPFFIIHIAFLIFPIYFLIQAKKNTKSSNLEDVDPSGTVTDTYLDEVINAPDEEIDFEEDLDLR